MYLSERIPEVLIDKIKSYVIFLPKTNEELKRAVELWSSDKKQAHKLYGYISLWNTQNITNMSHLFDFDKNFNSVISSWDVSNVVNMSYMFYNSILSYSKIECL